MKPTQSIQENQTTVLSTLNPAKAIVRLAVPATLAQLAKAIYNIVDTVYIGMLGSDVALAAVGVTLPLLLIMVSIENIFAAGAAVLAGRQLGAGNHDAQTAPSPQLSGFPWGSVFCCAYWVSFLSNPLPERSALPTPYWNRQRPMHFGCLSPLFSTCLHKA